MSLKVRPFSYATIAFGVFPLFLPLAITACGGPETYFSLAIIAFGAFQFSILKYYYRWGEWTLRNLASLFKKVTVLKEKRIGCFDIFSFLSAQGRGKGESEEPGGGRFVIEKARGGGVRSPGWVGGGGEGLGGCLREIFGGGGGGAKFLFSRPKFPPSKRRFCWRDAEDPQIQN